MQMGMVKQILAPGVKNGKEADVGAEMLGIGSNRLERLGGRPKENAVEGALVLQADVGNLFGHSKDNMKIFGLEKLRLSVLDPLGACQGLAFGTVTVGAGVEPDALVAAPVTYLDVTTESGGAAPLNRGHHASLWGR